MSCEGDVPLLFTENDTNNERLFPGLKNESPYVKDGINDCVVHGDQGAVNPAKQGTKVAAHYKVNVGAGQTAVIRLRLTKAAPDAKSNAFGQDFDEIFAARLREADEFYQVSHAAIGQCRRGQRHAPGPRGHALEQAVLLLRRGQLAR